MSAHWSWIWPSVGPTPTTDDLNSEMFDRADYPYTDTFVREAIQNSLDARLNLNEPVLIRFNFHEGKLGSRSAFLTDAIGFRQTANLAVPNDWGNGRISWVTVEDFNTTGLLGGLADRKGDFWGYWLNFGRSNKTAAGRGGRGIGRVTFLIASKLNTVIGLTRRKTDKRIAACGMCVLKADDFGDGFKSTHSYLAAGVEESIYKLHESVDFHEQLEKAFNLASFTDEPDRTGLSLVIPYPHGDLDDNGILAAAIDHFAPAILNGSLVVEVGIDRLDAQTIHDVAPCVAEYIKTKSVRDDVERNLNTISSGLVGSDTDLRLPNGQAKLADHRETETAKKLRSDLNAGSQVVFNLKFPMTHKGITTDAIITAVAMQAPYGKAPLDRLYREGMSLPDVKARTSTDLDLVLLVEAPPLADYLNLCEGKAHLDLLESMDVKSKLAKEGFTDGIGIKRLVKALPDELRAFLTEQTDKPDTTVWEAYFSVPDDEGRKADVPEPTDEADETPLPPPPPPPLPPPNIPPVVVHDLTNGFRLSANREYEDFPTTIEVVIAYADGRGNPSWSPYDFTADDLNTSVTNCSAEFHENRLKLMDWCQDSSAEVTGFDVHRELDTRIRVLTNAS